jgi:hypothetical protein
MIEAASPNVGRHELSFEEPDTIVYRLRGPLAELEARSMVVQHRSWVLGKPYFLVLCDLRGHEGSSPGARKALMELGHGLPRRAIAVFGGSFTLRTMADLMMRAMRLVGRVEIGWRHFQDEATCRAWLRGEGKRLGG